jgi:hypothetical protein
VIPVPIDQLAGEHIRGLIANGVREWRTREYKRLLPGNSDSERKEFLADVSSFANASGGDLFYGIDAADGVPTNVAGLKSWDRGSFNVDKDVPRLEAMIRDGVQPRITGITTGVIEGLTEGPVLVLRIERSWAGPHMVTYKGSSRFFGRSSAGKYPMDVGELRAAFALTGTLPERIRDWRNERVAIVAADETPVSLVAGPKCVLHIIPLDSFENQYRVAGRTVTTHSPWFGARTIIRAPAGCGIVLS